MANGNGAWRDDLGACGRGVTADGVGNHLASAERVRLVARVLLLGCLASAARATPPTTGALDGVDAEGRTVRLQELRGKVVIVTLCSRYTRREIERVDDVLRLRAGDDPVVFTVVDFIGIPRLFHGYARRKVREGELDNPIHLLVDVEGRWRRALGAAPDKRVDIFVFDRAGVLRGHFAGLPQVGRALALADRLQTAS